MESSADRILEFVAAHYGKGIALALLLLLLGGLSIGYGFKVVIKSNSVLNDQVEQLTNRVEGLDHQVVQLRNEIRDNFGLERGCLAELRQCESELVRGD